MSRYIFYSILLWFGTLLFAACHNDDLCGGAEQGGAATLRLVVKSAEGAEKGLRGVTDLDDNGTVSEAELIVDGSRMYRLCVCLVNSGQIVTSITLEPGDARFRNEGAEAEVSFVNLDYSKTYELYAVANYGNYGTVTGALANFQLASVTSNPTIQASSDNICSASTAYPLTLHQQVRLNPGVNNVSGTLKRTYARLRINVRNQSAQSDLAITNLKFADRFTRRSVNLFTEGGAAEVAPVATSSQAVTPFVAGMTIPKISESGSVGEATVFDAYMLESDGGNYNYTLNLKYGGMDAEVYKVSTTAVTNYNNIENGAMYVMYNPNSGRYLYANGNSVETGYLNSDELDYNYVWKLTRTNNYYQYWQVESMGATGYFMQSSNVSKNRVPLVTNPSSSDYFTVTNESGYLRFRSTKSQYFLSVDGSSVVGHNSSSNQNRRNFYLYKVEKASASTSVTKQATIPINIVNPTTGLATPLTAIRRNDFVEVLVNVSYNDKTGDIDFEVADWDQVDGEVTFD